MGRIIWSIGGYVERATRSTILLVFLVRTPDKGGVFTESNIREYLDLLVTDLWPLDIWAGIDVEILLEILTIVLAGWTFEVLRRRNIKNCF